MNQRTKIPSAEDMQKIMAGDKSLASIPEPPRTVFGNPVKPLDTKAAVVEAATRAARDALRSRKATPAEIRQGLDLLMQKHDYSPVEELILLAKTTQDEAVEMKIAMFLTEFLVPKLKSVEVKGQVDHIHQVVIRRFGQQDTPLPQKLPGLPPTAELEKVIDAEVADE